MNNGSIRIVHIDGTEEEVNTDRITINGMSYEEWSINRYLERISNESFEETWREHGEIIRTGAINNLQGLLDRALEEAD